MKFLLVLSIALVCVGLSKQFSSFENCDDKHPVFANKKVYNDFINQCVHVTCSANGSFGVKNCAEARCAPGKQIGEIDVNKVKNEVYPACCGGPICAEEE